MNESGVLFRVLGPVGFEVEGSAVVLTASRQRALLALLVLHANQTVSAASLIEGIWGAAIPQHPDAALQIVVSRLRALMGSAGERVVFDSAGYQLVIADDEADLLAARAGSAEASTYLESDPERAARIADAALRWWNGDALAGLEQVPFHDNASRELGDLRVSIYEVRNDAYLACGRHLEVLADIAEWVAREPWRERLRGQQMLALYRAGRQVDAIAAFQELRSLLVDDFGVDPGKDIRELSTRILEHDPSLLADSPSPSVATTLPRWTAQALPFVGRMGEEELLIERLREIAAGGIRMVLVDGDAGIGKSRFVLEVARRVLDDAVVVPISGDDTFRPVLPAIASALVEPTLQLSDAEIRQCVGRWPGDVCSLAPVLRDRLPGCPPPLETDHEMRAERLRAAVISWISGLSQRAPIVVILDDLHRAGAGLLRLLGLLMTDDEPKRVLVVATARTLPPGDPSRLAQLLRALDRIGTVDRVELTGLTAEQISRLLAHLDHPHAARQAERLRELSNGNPFLLGELLQVGEFQTLDRPDGEDTLELTDRMRLFVMQRLELLGQSLKELLQIAALVEGAFDVPLLAEVSRQPEGVIAALLERALAAGVVHGSALGSYELEHEIMRAAAAESVAEYQRGVLHARIASALESRGASAGTLAAHWSRATGPDAAGRTVKWAEAAGDDAMRNFDAGVAARWFEQAIAAADDPALRTRLMVRLAKAQCYTGGTEHVATLLEAMRSAREIGDPDLLVEAARIWAPAWSRMTVLSRGDRIALLRDAATAASDPAVRAQLLARVATEFLYGDEQSQARALVDEAMSSARRSGDPTVLTEVLLRHYQIAFTADTLEERRANMAEVLSITTERNDLVGRFFGLIFGANAAVESVDLVQADMFLAGAFDLVDRLRLPVLDPPAFGARAWRAGLRGHLDEAEELAKRASDCAMRHGVAFPMLAVTMQVGCIRWHQERLGELLPLLNDPPSWMRVTDEMRALLCSRALVSSPETREQARPLLDRVSAQGFSDLPRDDTWATSLILAGEVAAALDHADAGRAVYRLLEPLRDRVASLGYWILAPIAYGAALGAPACGDPASDELFEEAVDISARLEAPVLRARAELAWARSLAARETRSTRDRARKLLDAASDVLVERGCARALDARTS